MYGWEGDNKFTLSHVFFHLQFCHRNVEDSTVTLDGGRRDFLLALNGILLVGGEDKTLESHFDAAKSDCQSKHKGANACLYGRLEYILLIATAGDRIGLYAMKLDEGFGALTEIVPSFHVRTSVG
jgi:hypothetical protein